ncbi:MAG: hypothetical protein LBP28_09245 [Coriobacteriales bacterium]|jgi:hypothetical protein|nr:hypothetical protein [Coriobacteriales bacterium]
MKRPDDSSRQSANQSASRPARQAARQSTRQAARQNSRRPVVALALLAFALLLIAWGVVQGDALDTLHKAALICFECIGIG